MTTYSQCKERAVLPSWKLVTSFVLQWARFILRWTRLLYFRGCTLSYVGHVFCTSADARTNICTICTTSYVEHVFCTSVGAFHYTLDTSSVLRWAHYILRWTRILSASWPEEKRSAGALAKRILQHTFLVPTAIKQRFSVDPSRIAVSKDTKMIVDLWQTPGFEQKEIKTDLKK